MHLYSTKNLCEFITNHSNVITCAMPTKYIVNMERTTMFTSCYTMIDIIYINVCHSWQ